MKNAQLDNIEGATLEDTTVVRLIMSRVDGVLPGMTDRIQWIDLNTAEPELFKFKNKHKNDPVANGELEEIKGGVRRPAELQAMGGNDKNKGSFLENIEYPESA